MRKFTLILMALATVAMVLSGCKKKASEPESESESETQPVTKVATTFVTVPQSAVRTNLDGTTSVWTEGDVIKVFTALTPEGDDFTLTEGEGTAYGKFTGETTADGPYTAAYPASMASMNGSTLTFNLPKSQEAAVESYGTNVVPVVAFSDTKELSFKNTMGLFRLSLKSLYLYRGLTGYRYDVVVDSIVITDKSGKKLNGTFEYDSNKGYLVKSTDDGDSSIKLYSDGGQEVEVDKATDFYFCLPVGALSGGFKISIYGDAFKYVGDRRTLSAEVEYAGSDKTIERSKCVSFEVSDVELKCKCAKYAQGISGYKYPVVRIANQCWIAENLHETQYDTESEAYKAGIYNIPDITTLVDIEDYTGVAGFDFFTPYYYRITEEDLYEGILSPEDYAKLGYLYNWAAACGFSTAAEAKETHDFFNGVTQGICPNGYKIPKYYLGISSISGYKIPNTSLTLEENAAISLRSKTGWSTPGRDDFGFNALPAGYINLRKASKKMFFQVNAEWDAHYWLTDNDGERADEFGFGDDDSGWFSLSTINAVEGDPLHMLSEKRQALAVRCMQDVFE